MSIAILRVHLGEPRDVGWGDNALLVSEQRAFQFLHRQLVVERGFPEEEAPSDEVIRRFIAFHQKLWCACTDVSVFVSSRLRSYLLQIHGVVGVSSLTPDS